MHHALARAFGILINSRQTDQRQAEAVRHAANRDRIANQVGTDDEFDFVPVN